MKVSAIIPAAGSGQRFGEAKQFKLLKGRSVLFHTVTPFIESDQIHEVILVVDTSKVDDVQRDVMSISGGKRVAVVSGGARRQDSVQQGIQATSDDIDYICIHDGARPFVTKELIQKTIDSACESDGAILAIPCHDTVKYSENYFIQKTIDREKVWFAQTPQVFQKNKLYMALDNAVTNNLSGTDESALMENMGYSIKLVEGHVNNFKITTQEDWTRAESLFESLEGVKND